MSLYNMLFGMNPLTPLLKEMLYLDKVGFEDAPDNLVWVDDKGEKHFDYEKVMEGGMEEDEAWEKYKDELVLKECYPTGRFRDIFYDPDKKLIILYTRNGGGNREYYQYVFDLLRKHPNYVRDYDDSFDCTYAYIEFSVPEMYKKFLDELTEGTKVETVSEKFDRACKELEDVSPEELKTSNKYKAVREVIEAIMMAVKKVEDNEDVDGESEVDV